MTIQLKATEQYFPVVLFIILYKEVLTSESVCEISVTIQMKATETLLSYGAVYYAVKAGFSF